MEEWMMARVQQALASPVGELFAEAGFDVVWTGGGTLAWSKITPEGGAQALISIPEDEAALDLDELGIGLGDDLKRPVFQCAVFDADDWGIVLHVEDGLLPAKEAISRATIYLTVMPGVSA